MTITFTKQEIDFLARVLGEVPAKFAYEALKLIETKLEEAKKAEAEKNIKD